jgi:predicted ATP-grasp superfamily ATP-dependent carboligase
LSANLAATAFNRQNGHRLLSKRDIPALVLGAGITALGTIRALGQAGIPVYFASANPQFVSASRWYNKIDVPAADTPCLETLRKVLDTLSFERMVLVPCADNWVRAVANLPAEYKARFISSVPSAEIIELLVDKQRFAKALECAKIPHPRTLLLKSLDDLQQVPDEYLEGAFLKPCDSQSFMRAYGVKGCRVDSRQEGLKHLSNVLKDGFSMVLQQYISGPPTSHYFIDGYVGRDGKMAACFSRRRLRMFPADFGNSTYMRSVPLEEVHPAVESLEKLWSAIDYKGIFSAEFKQDPRDSQFKILEVNARPWWYIEFATFCGVNIAEMAYRDALQLPIKTVTNYRIGRRAIFLYEDRKAYRCLAQQHQISFFPWLASCLTSHEMTFNWRDPLPSLKYYADYGIGYLRNHLLS